MVVKRTSRRWVELFLRVKAMIQAVVSKVVGRFVRDERGATMLEYGLLVGLIAVVAIAAVTTMGTTLQGFFSDANTQLQ